MFSTNVEYFCEFWFFHYEKIMRFSPWKIGKYTRWASCWDQYSWVSAIPEDCHFCTEISKRRTIMQATVPTATGVFFAADSKGLISPSGSEDHGHPQNCATGVKDWWQTKQDFRQADRYPQPLCAWGTMKDQPGGPRPWYLYDEIDNLILPVAQSNKITSLKTPERPPGGRKDDISGVYGKPLVVSITPIHLYIWEHRQAAR